MNRIALVLSLLLLAILIPNSNVVYAATKKTPNYLYSNVLYGDWEVIKCNDGPIDIDTCSYYVGINLSKGDSTNPRTVDYTVYDGCNYIYGEYVISPTGKVTMKGYPIVTEMDCPYEWLRWTPNLDGTIISIKKESDGKYRMYVMGKNGKIIMILEKNTLDFEQGIQLY